MAEFMTLLTRREVKMQNFDTLRYRWSNKRTIWLGCCVQNIVSWKYSPPCIRSTCLYSFILRKNLKLLGIFAARKMFGVDIVSFSSVKNLYFLYWDAYVCIVYIDVPKVHWQIIYCERNRTFYLGHVWTTWHFNNINFYLQSTDWKLTKLGCLYPTVMYS